MEDDIFRTIIPLKAREGTTHITTPMATQIPTQIISERIIDLVRRNPAISRRKLAEVLGDITEDGFSGPMPEVSFLLRFCCFA